MKKIDAEQLAKDIEAIPGLCDDGKRGVRQLFANNFDVKFEAPEERPKRGEVWGDSYRAPLLITEDGKTIRLEEAAGEYRDKSIDEYLNATKWKRKKLANSPKEYFELKSQGKL